MSSLPTSVIFAVFSSPVNNIRAASVLPCLAALWEGGPMTCSQLSKRLGVVHATVRSSMRALKNAGFVSVESQGSHGILGRAEILYRVREGIYKPDTSLQQAVDLLKRYRAVSPQPGELYLDNNEFLATQP